MQKSTYNILASADDLTVVSEYTPVKSKATSYQSEAELEKELIDLLKLQGYEYVQIHKEKDLIDNLRHQLELLNDYIFSDSEWESFFTQILANKNNSIVEKTRMIQRDNIQVLTKDDGLCKNITLIDRVHIHNNRLQVINQYVNDGGARDNRYDVTILVNGFPMVHCELKRRGVAIKQAFNEINRYQKDSFWAESGLFEYIQIFIISNGTHTKYYSNTTRRSRIEEASGGKGSIKKTSNSFEFTSYWADGKNRIIPDLVDFTKTFLAKHTLLNILTRFCVFTAEDLLLVMRPYQITATERILNRIEIATNYHKEGTIEAGGYIWHTTGSGKTLVSFKTAQLASELPYIDKVLFVVDRQDLDYQTMKEYDRFERGAADGNTSTKVLENQLSDKDRKGNPHTYRIIITTIQKLSRFVHANKSHPIAGKRVVIIFDECHRSQFGDMHKDIIGFFKKYYLFGFTGTPIFAKNAGYTKGKFLTTPQLFGGLINPKTGRPELALHTYTIVDAINDENVLPFRIDYINTMRAKDGRDALVNAIDKESALASPERIREIVTYVLDHYDQKTKRGSKYAIKGRYVNGFNSIFAAQSVPAAIMYYKEFKRQIEERDSDLVIATIFSFAPNEPEADVIPEEGFETDQLDKSSRDALDRAIDDYNDKFGTSYNTRPVEYQNYYKDISQRMKNREIDILIVVNMLLTGFDATTLNTLWVDKNLRMHGLIQAFSRTNRILNSVKTYGNIVCFRNLEKQVDEAIGLFGDGNASSIVLLKDYDSYYEGYDEEKNGTVRHYPGYRELVDKLVTKFPLGVPLVGKKEEKDFIGTYSSLLRVMNILTAFDRFEEERLLSDRDMQDYQSIYIDLYDGYRGHIDKENISDDVVFELELVKQIEVDIDYILDLVKKYHEKNCMNEEAETVILKAVDSSTKLRSKKELIREFLKTINVGTDVEKDWAAFVEKQKEEDIRKIIDEEKLKPEETRRLMDESFSAGALKTSGTKIDTIMPPISHFWNSGREEKKTRIIEKLSAYFYKYYGLGA